LPFYFFEHNEGPFESCTVGTSVEFEEEREYEYTHLKLKIPQSDCERAKGYLERMEHVLNSALQELKQELEQGQSIDPAFPLLIKEDEPDTYLPDVCMNANISVLSCEPHHRIGTPDTLDEINKVNDEDANLQCSLSVDKVREIFGDEMDCFTMDHAYFARPSRDLLVQVGLTTSQQPPWEGQSYTEADTRADPPSLDTDHSIRALTDEMDELPGPRGYEMIARVAQDQDLVVAVRARSGNGYRHNFKSSSEEETRADGFNSLTEEQMEQAERLLEELLAEYFAE
jgi:hypothetical protein